MKRVVVSESHMYLQTSMYTLNKKDRYNVSSKQLVLGEHFYFC